METRKTIWGSLVLASSLLLPLGACSDDKDAEPNTGTGGNGSDSGMQPPTGMPSPEDASTGTPGQKPPVVPDGGQPPNMMLTCDESVPTTATCGGTMCPEITGVAAMLCSVPCCVGDVCGTANTSAEMPRACTASPQPDPSCPTVDVMGAIELPGCCTPEGKCGVISSISNSCITSSTFVMLPENPQPCGSDAGTVGDAGTAGDAGATDGG